MEQPRLRVTVAIVAYESGHFLQRCIDALAVQTFEDFEAVILDNASTDGSVDRLRLPDSRFRVERLGANLGFAVANNVAARMAHTEWFATLNPDAIPDQNWLQALIEATLRWPNAASFGSTQISLEQPDVLDGVGDVWHAAGVAWRARCGWPVSAIPDEGEIFGPCAAAALYRRAAYLRAGGFDESYFCYCEDVDLAYRLRLGGEIAVQVPSAVVHHAGSGVSGRISNFTLFHGHRNRIWTFLKNTPGIWLWLLLPWHLAYNVWMLWSGWRQGFGLPIARAYIAALKGIPHIWKSRRLTQATMRANTRVLFRAMAWSPLAPRRRDLVRGWGPRKGGSES